MQDKIFEGYGRPSERRARKSLEYAHKEISYARNNGSIMWSRFGNGFKIEIDLHLDFIDCVFYNVFFLFFFFFNILCQIC